MLIEHKTTGEKLRAIRFQIGGFMTSCGNMIPAEECLVYCEGIWWDFRQVMIQTGDNFVNAGIRLPDFAQPVQRFIARVLAPCRKALDMRNLNCLTPL